MLKGNKPPRAQINQCEFPQCFVNDEHELICKVLGEKFNTGCIKNVALWTQFRNKQGWSIAGWGYLCEQHFNTVASWVLSAGTCATMYLTQWPRSGSFGEVIYYLQEHYSKEPQCLP